MYVCIYTTVCVDNCIYMARYKRIHIHEYLYTCIYVYSHSLTTRQKSESTPATMRCTSVRNSCVLVVLFRGLCHLSASVSMSSQNRRSCGWVSKTGRKIGEQNKLNTQSKEYLQILIIEIWPFSECLLKNYKQINYVYLKISVSILRLLL